MIYMFILLALIACAVVAGITAIIITVILRHNSKLEKTHTITDELIERPLATGVYMICGPQRVGKTSFLNALISIDAKYHGAERLAKAQLEADYMNAIEQENRYHLKVPPCAYRTRSKLFLPNGLPTYHIDISSFGLPGKPGKHYLPPWTVIGIDEVDSYMDCRRWQEDKSDIIDGLKYIGHQDLVVLMDCQALSKVDAAVRKLITDTIYILHKQDFYTTKGCFKKRKTLVRTEWDCIWCKHQLLENVATLGSMGVDIAQDKYVRRCKLVYNGNIYTQYNAQSGKPYWYAGIDNFTIERHPDNALSRDGINQYTQQNALKYSNEHVPKVGNKNPS